MAASDNAWPPGDRVAGYCPMGCGQTLFLGAGGHVTCRALQCPNPTAVDELIADSETEHVVRLDEDGFTVLHPLRERIDGSVGRTLFDCPLHGWTESRPGPPTQLGMYRVRLDVDDPVNSTWGKLQ